MLIVQVCDFGNDGDALYRIHQPSRYLNSCEGVTAVDCHFSHRMLPKLAAMADILLVQFVNDWDLLALCERRKADGKITVFEANDDFFDLQAWSPNAARWRDRTLQEIYRQSLVVADGVQTSSETLAQRWQSMGAKNIAVFKNQLIEVPPLEKTSDRPLTVGWGGSPGHFADWKHVSPALSRWLREHPEVHLAVMTNEIAKPFIDVPAERYHFTPFGSLDAYLQFLNKLDIGLAPLLPTNYNRGRSDVKFLEYASRGVAGVYADLDPYRSSVIENMTGLFYRTPEDLVANLERLRTRPGLRESIRLNAHTQVKTERRLSDHIHERVNFYKHLLRCSSKPFQLTSDIDELVDKTQGYPRLLLGEPEQTLLEVTRTQDRDDVIPRLERLVQSNPGYLAPRQTLGRLRNDRRQLPEATQALEAALALDPQNPRTLGELARSHFLLGNGARSKRLLEAAVKIAPRHFPSWTGYLRLLGLIGSAEGPMRADQAESIFPSCYPLGIAALQARPADQVAEALVRLLHRIGPTITVEERPLAASAFRQAIDSALQRTNDPAIAAKLLRKGFEIFPESSRLAGMLGAALHRTGESEEAYQHEANALRLRRLATLDRDEALDEVTFPIPWLLAEQIVKTGSIPNLSIKASTPVQTPSNNDLRIKAYDFYRQSNMPLAESAARRLIEIDPQSADGWYLLGVLAMDANRLDEAVAIFDKTAAFVPSNPIYANTLGEALLANREPAKAEACVRRSIALDPTYARAHNNLGRLLHSAGDLQGAGKCFREAVRLQPRYPVALNNLGALLQAEQNLDEAASRFRQAIEAKPDYPEAHFNLGCTRQAQGNLVDAMKHLRESIRLRPNYGRAHFQLGQVLEQARRDYEALDTYQTAAILLPDDPEVHRRLGMHLVVKKDWPAALAALERASALAPDQPETFASLFNARQQICDWSDYEAGLERLWNESERLIAMGESTAVSPFQSLTLPWSVDRLKAVADSHGNAWARNQRRYNPSLAFSRKPSSGGRIRVGYLSGDYYDHPISHLIHGLFGHHDRDRFEVFAYSFGPPDQSSYRTRIMSEVEHFVEIGHLSPADLARKIDGDGIQILVDLMGHTGVNRLSALALRAAPLQVSFLGMLGTIGGDFMDYLITDRIVTPPEFAPWFSEKFATLPHSYLIAEPEPELPSIDVDRPSLGLPEDGFVFCCFNSAYKIEPRSFAAWMRILSAVPGSVLWLCSPGKVVEENLRREAKNRGIEPDRLVFAPFVPRPSHLKRHQAADLFLDSLLYNAAATASLALQVGVPVLTCLGETFASRVGASVVTAAGLSDLVAKDISEYERMAIQLAADPERLDSLRAHLKSVRTSAPLFDTASFVSNMETAYQIMWNRHAEGLPPAPFAVTEVDRDETEAESQLAMSR